MTGNAPWQGGSLRLFACNSYLQILTIESTLRLLRSQARGDSAKPGADVLIYEGPRYQRQFDPSAFTRTIEIPDTRPVWGKPAARLREAQAVVDESLGQLNAEKCELFLSDQRWLLNKILLARMKERGTLVSYSLVDEGTLMYSYPTLEGPELVGRDFAKRVWLSLNRLPNPGFFTHYGWQDPKLKAFFVLWENCFRRAFPGIDASKIATIGHFFDGVLRDYYARLVPHHTELADIHDATVYISQPYYRVYGLARWKEMIRSTLARFAGKTRMFIKPYPAEEPSMIEWMRTESGATILEDADWAVEVLAFNRNVTFVSHTSSSLANIKLVNPAARAVAVFDDLFESAGRLLALFACADVQVVRGIAPSGHHELA